MDKYIKNQIMKLDSLYKKQAGFYHKAAVWSGLSDATYWVMFYVCWKMENVSQSELCADYSYSKQTINSAVTKRLKQELVTLETSEENKKRKMIKLTSAGKTFCDKYVKPILKEKEILSLKLKREKSIKCFRP